MKTAEEIIAYLEAVLNEAIEIHDASTDTAQRFAMMLKAYTVSELLDEIETIVYSGTKLNIDYFIEDVMDEDVVEDIYEYFRESETDDLETAFENLDEDYTEDEIRLVRIKFISEMAN
jgi:hypothetical protein